MNTAFYLTFGLLIGLVLLEGIGARFLIREILWLKRLLTDLPEDDTLPPHAPMPSFSGEHVDGRPFCSRDLPADDLILYFVRPRERELPAYGNFEYSLSALWHKVDGRLVLVCQGTVDECRPFSALLSEAHGHSHTYTTLLDRDGEIAKSFRVSRMPRAVFVNDEGHVSKYGQPIPNDESMVSEGFVGVGASIA